MLFLHLYTIIKIKNTLKIVFLYFTQVHHCLSQHIKYINICVLIDQYPEHTCSWCITDGSPLIIYILLYGGYDACCFDGTLSYCFDDSG